MGRDGRSATLGPTEVMANSGGGHGLLRGSSEEWVVGKCEAKRYEVA